MKIEQIIGIDTLGDINTDDDNSRFAAAVKTALTNEYPDAEIVVELGEHSEINVSDFDDDDQPIVENVQKICSGVWGQADY